MENGSPGKRELRRHWDIIAPAPTPACHPRDEHPGDCEDYVQCFYRMGQAVNPGEAVGNDLFVGTACADQGDNENDAEGLEGSPGMAES